MYCQELSQFQAPLSEIGCIQSLSDSSRERRIAQCGASASGPESLALFIVCWCDTEQCPACTQAGELALLHFVCVYEPSAKTVLEGSVPSCLP